MFSKLWRKNDLEEEEYYIASQWQLIWRKFRKHRLALLGGGILAFFYIAAIFCEFISPYDIYKRHRGYVHCPPQRVHFFDKEEFSLRPFVYGLKLTVDDEKWRRLHTTDETKKYYLRFLVRGDEYELWNLFRTDIHLFAVEEGEMFLFGTDKYGRDHLSRTLYPTRTSLSIGLVGVLFVFVLGSMLGGVCGFYAGSVDAVSRQLIK